ncbi:MAG: 6-bladed beta-propeller, partial [Alphaproteobacteria bacterium]
TSIAVGPEGNIFVADFYNHRIQKFSPDGTFLTAFGSKGHAPGEFFHPIAVDVAPDGTVFVTDHGNSRVQKWRQ